MFITIVTYFFIIFIITIIICSIINFLLLYTDITIRFIVFFVLRYHLQSVVAVPVDIGDIPHFSNTINSHSQGYPLKHITFD